MTDKRQEPIFIRIVGTFMAMFVMTVCLSITLHLIQIPMPTHWFENETTRFLIPALSVLLSVCTPPYFIGKLSWATHTRWVGLLLPMLILLNPSDSMSSFGLPAMVLRISMVFAAFFAGDLADQTRRAKEQQALKIEADQQADEVFGKSDKD